MASRLDRAFALGGLLGPVAFTAAWVTSTIRQPGYNPAHEHISGLAAPDARAPHVMTAGFVALGLGTVAFAAGLERRLGGSTPAGNSPVLIGASGTAMVIAGLFRRDRMSNSPAPGDPPGQSWVNDVHDAASVIGSVTSAVGMFTLAARLRAQPGLGDLARPTAVAALTGSALLAWFTRGVTRQGNGIVQRVGVSIPLMVMARLAVRLLRSER